MPQLLENFKGAPRRKISCANGSSGIRGPGGASLERKGSVSCTGTSIRDKEEQVSKKKNDSSNVTKIPEEGVVLNPNAQAQFRDRSTSSFLQMYHARKIHNDLYLICHQVCVSEKVQCNGSISNSQSK